MKYFKQLGRKVYNQVVRYVPRGMGRNDTNQGVLLQNLYPPIRIPVTLYVSRWDSNAVILMTCCLHVVTLYAFGHQRLLKPNQPIFINLWVQYKCTIYSQITTYLAALLYTLYHTTWCIAMSVLYAHGHSLKRSAGPLLQT